VEGLYYPTPVTPEEAFQAIGRLRKEARDAIDQLIQFLDKTDDYVCREVEDQVDDWPCDDNELDGPENGEDEDSDPAEPSLGSIEDHPNGYQDSSDWNGRGRTQENWASGNRDDREGDEHDGREPEDDSEPSLGAFGHEPERRLDKQRPAKLSGLRIRLFGIRDRRPGRFG
jgi:hypothetical protein